MKKYQLAKMLSDAGYKIQYRSTGTHSEAIFLEIDGKFLNIDTDEMEFEDVLTEIDRLKSSNSTGARLSHGGKRPGAGRPATGAMPTRGIRMTDEEYEQVKAFLAELRAK